MNTVSQSFPLFVLTAALAAAAEEITVHYYNEAGVPARLLEQAVGTANSALRRAEIRVKWVNCYRDPEACTTAAALRVSIVEAAEPALRAVSFAMGHSLLPQGGQGVYAKVFCNRVKQYAQSIDAPTATVLGNAIAHEIGHLLLGSGEHSRQGIMKAQWSGAERESLRSGRIRFQGHEAARMRRRAAEMTSLAMR